MTGPSKDASETGEANCHDRLLSWWCAGAKPIVGGGHDVLVRVACLPDHDPILNRHITSAPVSENAHELGNWCTPLD